MPDLNTPSAKTVTLIECQFNRGDGSTENPHRLCTALFRMDGEHIVTRDPFEERERKTLGGICFNCGGLLEHGHCKKCRI